MTVNWAVTIPMILGAIMGFNFGAAHSRWEAELIVHGGRSE